MTTGTAYSQYKQNTVFTARPQDLTMMLYGGLVKFIMQGINYIEKKDYENANDRIIRAQLIIVELKCTLDIKYEISKNLSSLYEYMHERLLDANIQKSIEILSEVLEFARELRETWEQVIKLSKNSVERAKNHSVDIMP